MSYELKDENEVSYNKKRSNKQDSDLKRFKRDFKFLLRFKNSSFTTQGIFNDFYQSQKSACAKLFKILEKKELNGRDQKEWQDLKKDYLKEIKK